jgi:DMSO/TMAO reductase YedYZ molybdopterin-dependent catalytic subunit
MAQNDQNNQNERLIKTKETWAKVRRGGEEREVFDTEPSDRLPPGQHLQSGWPVLDIGRRPAIALPDWRLTVTGFVATPIVWTWDDFLAQPQTTVVSDFHCVTSWSTFNNEWVGVRFKHLIDVVRPLSLAKYVLFTAYDDYTTNLPLDACDDEDVLLVHQWNGRPLTLEHGGPLRMIVPKRYGWKSAKWIKTITFSDRDEKGFWEVRGYSNTALPWNNDRYS